MSSLLEEEGNRTDVPQRQEPACAPSLVRSFAALQVIPHHPRLTSERNDYEPRCLGTSGLQRDVC